MKKLLSLICMVLMLRVYWDGGAGMYLHPTGASSVLVKLDNGKLKTVMYSHITNSEWVEIKTRREK